MSADGEGRDGGLTHVNDEGQAQMVDVGDKPVTRRVARAEVFVHMEPETAEAILAGNMPKGDVAQVARLAGVMAAKRTGELIPLCHPVALDYVQVELTISVDHVRVEAAATSTGKTGVEMEAMTAASVAALTVYDMAKARDRGMRISGLRLLEKSGGASGVWVASDQTA
jgi:cyclic pyranopterin phosphate synthase